MYFINFMSQNSKKGMRHNAVELCERQMKIEEVKTLNECQLEEINSIRKRISLQEYSVLDSKNVTLESIPINDRNLLFLAMNEKRIVGYCTLGESSLECSDKERESSLEIMFFFDPDYQTKGKGFSLASFAIERAKNLVYVEKISAWVKKDNSASIGLLNKLDFELKNNKESKNYVFTKQIT